MIVPAPLASRFTSIRAISSGLPSQSTCMPAPTQRPVGPETVAGAGFAGVCAHAPWLVASATTASAETPPKRLALRGFMDWLRGRVAALLVPRPTRLQFDKKCIFDILNRTALTHRRHTALTLKLAAWTGCQFLARSRQSCGQDA